MQENPREAAQNQQEQLEALFKEADIPTVLSRLGMLTDAQLPIFVRQSYAQHLDWWNSEMWKRGIELEVQMRQMPK